ncbi:MmyB family transcriptional regulator [Nonomuraea rubra]
MTLAGALQVPLRERNDLLLAAGYAPLYRESAIAEPAMATIRAALDRVLAHHEPYPAVVMDRHWNLTQANRSAEVMFARLRGTPPATASANVIRLMFDPRELRPHVANWDEVAPPSSSACTARPSAASRTPPRGPSWRRSFLQVGASSTVRPRSCPSSRSPSPRTA